MIARLHWPCLARLSWNNSWWTFSETAFGQLVRAFTSSRYFSYTGERSGFSLAKYAWHENKGELETSACGVQRHLPVLDSADRSAGNGDTSVVRTSPPAMLGQHEERADLKQTTSTALEQEHHLSRPSGINRARNDVVLVGWYSLGAIKVPRDPDHWLTLFLDDPNNPHNWSPLKKTLIGLEIV